MTPVAGSVVVRSEDAMVALGRRLAPLLRAGDVVLLDGPLGAGKTTLARGIALGLGIGEPVTSPTFVIAREHVPTPGGTGLVHVDAYRLTAWDELDDLDLDAAMGQSVTVVEWGGGLAEPLAVDRLEISIEPGPDEARTVRLHGVGSRWTG